MFGSIFAHRTLILYQSTVFPNADLMKTMPASQLMKLRRNQNISAKNAFHISFLDLLDLARPK